MDGNLLGKTGVGNYSYTGSSGGPHAVKSVSNIAGAFTSHTDNLGSVIAITDINGNLKEALAYDAWGSRRNVAGAPVSVASTATSQVTEQTDDVGYTGQEMIDALELVHLNARVYDPLISRFLSGDSYVVDPANGQNFSRYTYVLNNPVRYSDPSGFGACDGVGPYTTAKDSVPVITICGQRNNLPDPMQFPGFIFPTLADFYLLPDAIPPSGQKSAAGNKSQESHLATKSMACKGTARVFQGNSNLVGQGGAFNANPSNLPLYAVTTTSATIAIVQFGLTKPQMRPIANQISGTFDNGALFNSVRDIIDDYGTRTSLGLTTSQFETYLVNRETPGNGGNAPLLIELPGASVDNGYQGITLTMPAGYECPQGTAAVN